MDPKRKITYTADGRIVASKPRADGPTQVEFPVPGELGALLQDALYQARIVVERVDGGALTERDRSFVSDAMAAAAQHGTHSPEVREAAATGHFARARQRLSEAETPKKQAAGGRGR